MPQRDLTSYDQEHVTPFIKRNAETHLVMASSKWSKAKLSIDTQADYDFAQKVYQRLTEMAVDGEVRYEMEFTMAAVDSLIAMKGV